MLLTHLDAASILELGKAHQPTLKVLQAASLLWDKLIQKTCPYNTRRPYGDRPDTPWLEKKLKAKKAKLLPLINLLAKMEEPEGFLVTLLATIK